MKIARLSPTEPRPPTESGRVEHGRRSFLHKLGLGALLAGLAGQGYALLRALVPNVLYEPPTRFKAGPPQDFPQGMTFLEAQRVFIARQQNEFHAISAVCTHLGCTVKILNLQQPKKAQIKGKVVEIAQEFHCPCHGSKYYGEGTNYAGPAPQPLAWYKLEIAPDDGQLVVDLGQTVQRDFRLKV